MRTLVYSSKRSQSEPTTAIRCLRRHAPPGCRAVRPGRRQHIYRQRNCGVRHNPRRTNESCVSVGIDCRTRALRRSVCAFAVVGFHRRHCACAAAAHCGQLAARAKKPSVPLIANRDLHFGVCGCPRELSRWLPSRRFCGVGVRGLRALISGHFFRLDGREGSDLDLLRAHNNPIACYQTSRK